MVSINYVNKAKMGKIKKMYRVISSGKFYNRYVIYAFQGDPIFLEPQVKLKFILLDGNYKPTFDTELFSSNQLEQVPSN